MYWALGCIDMVLCARDASHLCAWLAKTQNNEERIVAVRQGLSTNCTPNKTATTKRRQKKIQQPTSTMQKLT